jgi:alkanesulfonate monooxygenase SsuD/methylene tetrahydromethanopterin reductase-like flavin-dependent oxidoreductase (luciferase family)
MPPAGMGDRPTRAPGDVRVDLLLDPFGARWTDLRDAATVAVESGFGGIWTYDHVDGRVYGADEVLECWTVLSAVAAAVPGALVGPLVLNVANRHPGVLAAMAATLQEVSAGRLVLGLGAGAARDTPYAREQEKIGLPVLGAGERRAHVTDCVAELRRLWRTPGFLRPDPEPPVVIAAFGPKMAELAGRVGDGINTRATHPRLAELLAIARTAHDGAGGDPDRFLVTVFADFDEAWLSAESPTRSHLATLGVDRLILAVGAPFDRRRLAAAARWRPG